MTPISFVLRVVRDDVRFELLHRGWSAWRRFALGLLLLLAASDTLPAQTKAPLDYLDAFSDSYYPGTGFPKLTTPQWVGEEGVDAVITLGIDDMRDPKKYEAYLRPILNRLKKIDGRAPVSILTCSIDPNDPQLQAWLKEGLSIETHTFDHPCPLLSNNDFARAKSTYDRCVDLMNKIPGNKPVAFRFPCCDSLNTPSPRAFAEILNKTTPDGNFLQISSSVTCLFTPLDTELPKSLTTTENGDERFRAYIPFPSFVNIVENYPYPYVIGKLCWEFPITIPDDWQGQNIHRPANPKTVRDMIAAIDASVLKKGVANIVFHPHSWSLRPEQMVQVIDHVERTYGKRVKFLTFKECAERINRSMLLGEPIRAKKGGDNGVRLLDVNDDGYLDVLIGNERRRTLRLWNQKQKVWEDSESPLQITGPSEGVDRSDLGVRFGRLTTSGEVCALVNNERVQKIYRFLDGRFQPSTLPAELKSAVSSRSGVDQGLRIRDLTGDGVDELLHAHPKSLRAFRLNANGKWSSLPKLPAAIVDDRGRDNGVRLVDLDKDGFDDWVVSNATQSAIHLYDSDKGGFTAPVKGINDLPKIAIDGANNGAWFAKEFMWLQNERTNRLPDGVDRRSFQQLLGDTEPKPRSPEQAMAAFRVRPGFTIELVAAEPLVMDPIAMDWGPDGRLWVVEMADYPLGLDDRGKPGGRVRYLEDTDGDGRYDKSTLFLDGIPYPTGVMVWRDGVLVSAAPRIFFAKDTDGDGKADEREELFRGFVEGNQQHRVNGFAWGLDNWVYLANGDSGGVVESVKTGERVDIRGRDLRIRPDDGAMEAQTGQTQFGRHRDDHGNWFGSSNPLPVRHYVLAEHYLRRNPHIAGHPSRRDIARGDNSRLYPISRVLSHWSGYKPPGPGQPHRFTSACSTTVYRDTLFGPEFAWNTFTCEPVHNAVHRRRLIPAGVSFESRRPDDEPNFEFLASSDSWFRPTTVTTGPDGALWITDIYRLVIEHPEWIDDQREKELFLRAGHDRGRIYRVYPTARPPRAPTSLADRSVGELAEALASPNGRQRDLAQRLLVQRGDASAIGPLQEVVVKSTNAMARLHALCALDGLRGVDHKTLLRALNDSHPTVRRHAVRVGEAFLTQTGEDQRGQRAPESSARLLGRLAEMVNDRDLHVVLQLAYSLGHSRDDMAARTLARVARRGAGDPHLRAAVLSSLNGRNLAEFYAELANDRDAIAAYRAPVLQIAARLKDKRVASEIFGTLVSRAETDDLNPAILEEITRALAAFEPASADVPPKVHERLAKLVASAERLAESNAALSNRVAAVRFVAAAPTIDVDRQATILLDRLDAREPIEVQRAVVDSLVKLRSPDLPDKTLAKLAVLSPAIRSGILDQMLRRVTWTKVLVEALDQGRVQSQLVGPIHRQSLMNHADSGIRAAAKRILAPGVGEAKSALMKRYSAKIDGQANLEEGRKSFIKHCAVCHRLDGVGHPVGPDLLTIKNRSGQAMLTAILDPNRAVEDKYQNYGIQTSSGQTETGIIIDENSNGLVLQKQEGKRVVILRSEIETIRNFGKSLMPEGMEKELPPERMRDLLAYLQSHRPAHKEFAGNKPELVRAGEDGVLTLKASTSRIYGPKLVFETKYENLGFWSSVEDRAEWTVQVERPGRFEIWMEYACAANTAGNRVAISIGEATVRANVAGTGGWDDYRRVKIGDVQLNASTFLTTVRADGEMRPNSFLMDLQSIRLKRSP